MGVVYRARDPQIGRPVAIKLLHVNDEGVRERFLQEAQSAGNLTHRNIVTIYDFGEHDGQPFIVMEFVEGVTLAERIPANPDWPLTSRLELLEELAAGLDYAHNKGIVHRDVKPANLMIDRDGVLKILDFGIARVSNSGLTQMGALMGTPYYMSPEQIAGRPVDRRSDIFAVGLVMYEMLAGTKAFTGDSPHTVMSRILYEAPPPLDELCPDLDADVVGIVSHAIEKDAQRRYQSLAEMASAIKKARLRLGNSRVMGTGSTVRLPTPPPITPFRHTPRSTLDREALAKRRAERIEAQLRVAQDAFAAGDFGGAVVACEHAALLDPDEPRVLELLERARDALTTEQLRDWLNQARDCLDRGELDAAVERLDRARQIDPTDAGIDELQRALEDIRQQSRHEQQRRDSIAAALALARESFSDGRLESAIRSASEILIDDPTNEEARRISRDALSALEERRLREQQLRTARAAVEQQKRVFAAGRYRDAIETLEQITPSHEVIAAAIVEMRAALETIERQARAERERVDRERAEAEARRETVIAAHLAQAEREVGGGRLAEARAELDAVLALNPKHVEALTRRRHVEEAIEEERRRVAQVRQREEEGRAAVAQARQALAVRDFDGALKSIQEAESRGANHPELAGLRIAIEDGRRAVEHEQQARDLVADARRRFAGGDRSAAIVALQRFTPRHAVVTAALIELRASADEIDRLEREAGERRRLAAHVNAVLVRGNSALDAGDIIAAGQLADEAQVADPTNVEAQALKDRVVAAREDLREREEGVRRARTEAQNAARQQRVDDQLAKARAEIAAGHATEALVRLRRLMQSEGQVEGLPALLEQARSAQAAADRDFAQAAAERERARAVRQREDIGTQTHVPASAEAIDQPETVAGPASVESRSWHRRPALIAGIAVAATAAVVLAVWASRSKTAEPPRADPIAAIISRAQSQYRAGDVAGAVQSAVEGVKIGGQIAPLGELLASIRREAVAAMDAARQRAVEAGADGSDDFKTAEQRRAQADKFVALLDTGRAVADYAEVAGLYEQARAATLSVQEIMQLARQAVTDHRVPLAINYAEQVLAKDAANQDAAKLLERIRTTASQQAQVARKNALDAGATGLPEFADGDARSRQAAALGRGQTRREVELFNDATAAFNAAREAKRTADAATAAAIASTRTRADQWHQQARASLNAGNLGQALAEIEESLKLDDTAAARRTRTEIDDARVRESEARARAERRSRIEELIDLATKQPDRAIELLQQAQAQAAEFSDLSASISGSLARARTAHASTGSGTAVTTGNPVAVPDVESAAVADRKLVEGVMERYRQAYEQMNIDAIAQVFPGATRAKVFGNFGTRCRRLLLKFKTTSVDLLAGGRAQFETTSEYGCVAATKQGDELFPPVTTTFQLVKKGGSWVIVDILVSVRSK